MYARFLKPLLDRLFACLLVILLSPLLLLIALAVRVDSPGGPLFFQIRVGRFGRPFTLWKFRTMRVGSDQGPLLTQRGDPRVTRLGRFLRRWSLDELPQLVNIARGEMSFIGPRPEVPPLVAQWQPHERRILDVRPGLTGWAQIHGRDDLSIPEKIALDLDYAAHVSWRRDGLILWRTLGVVVSGIGTN